MSNKNNYKSSGTLTLNGKKLRGELIAEERLARFVTKKQTIKLPYPEIAVLKNVRNGGMASTITINAPTGKADAKRLMGIMRLAAKQGMELTITVEGADEEKAAAELQAFLAANL